MLALCDVEAGQTAHHSKSREKAGVRAETPDPVLGLLADRVAEGRGGHQGHLTEWRIKEVAKWRYVRKTYRAHQAGLKGDQRSNAGSHCHFGDQGLSCGANKGAETGEAQSTIMSRGLHAP